MAKRILAILVVCVLAVSAANPLIAVDTTSAATMARTTLMELFTATWCGYCAAYGPNADRAYDELGPQQVILLRDQVGQDGLDTDETNARANFYGVTGVPTLYVNGLYAYSPAPANYSAFVQRIRDMNSVAALFQVSVSAQVQGTTSQGTAAIEVKSLTSSGYGNLHLIVALFEKVVTYQGTNGVKTHRFVVRDYLFGETGEQVGLAGFQTRQFSYPLTLPNGSNPADFGIAAWIQDFSTKEILQAESAEIAVAGQGQHTISASTGEGGTISPSGATTVESGKDQMYVIVPAAGHHIQDVVIDGVSTGAVTSYRFTNVQANHNIQASFTPDSYALTVAPAVNGTVTKNPDQATYIFNVSVTVTATPAAGYTFAGWSGDLTGSTNPMLITIDRNRTITATFTTLPTYTLTSTGGTGGTITPSTPQTIFQGGSRTFAMFPTAGYHIVDVSVDGVSQGIVSSYTFSNVTSNHTISARFEQEKKQVVIVLQIGNSMFTVNGDSIALDSPPVIKNGRTLLPIRAIIEALGGTVGWDGTARKATVTLGSATIEFWIGWNAATVNGMSTLIDSTNAKVVPEIINSRTMLPLRFVSENLGCSVVWADATRTITIAYQS